jgi:hypothetical protein
MRGQPNIKHLGGIVEFVSKAKLSNARRYKAYRHGRTRGRSAEVSAQQVPVTFTFWKISQRNHIQGRQIGFLHERLESLKIVIL